MSNDDSDGSEIGSQDDIDESLEEIDAKDNLIGYYIKDVINNNLNFS